jgi:hypothetical protein
LNDGATNNDAAFALAEASSFDEIYIPSGIFYCATRTQPQFTKGYYGPGLILLADGTAMPGNFSYVNSLRTQWPVQGTTGFFRGDTRSTEGRWFMIGPTARQRMVSRYYDTPYIPNHNWMHVYDGGSGVDGRLTSSPGAGATSFTANGASSTWIGKQLAFKTNFFAGPTDTVTVSNVVGTTVTCTPTTASHSSGEIVTLGYRTGSPNTYVHYRNFAPGDAVAHVMRVDQNYGANAGQTHVFEASTAGLYGGDINMLPGSSGSMGTGIEIHHIDQGNDVGMIGARFAFVRDNDTGARSAAWVGYLTTSEGSKPADSGYCLQGKWRTGLDFVRCDFSTFYTASDGYNAAVQMALGHRMIFNSTATTVDRGGDATGVQSTLWGNHAGDIFLETGNDGAPTTSDFIAIRFNRASPNDGRLRVRPTVVQVNKQFDCAANINAGGSMSVGSGQQFVFGPGSGNFIQVSGGQFQFYIGGALAGTIP